MQSASVESYLFTLANNEVAKPGEWALTAANGQVQAGKVVANQRAIGVFKLRHDVTGDGSTKVEVGHETFVWAANDDVTAADVFKTVYVKTGSSVTKVATGGSPAGVAVALDPVHGVLVKVAGF
jgi:hypothetical protein